jgi:hypothetical protein
MEVNYFVIQFDLDLNKLNYEFQKIQRQFLDAISICKKLFDKYIVFEHLPHMIIIKVPKGREEEIFKRFYNCCILHVKLKLCRSIYTIQRINSSLLRSSCKIFEYYKTHHSIKNHRSYLRLKDQFQKYFTNTKFLK